MICALLALLVSGLALLLMPAPRASALANNDDGHVYVLNNDLVGSNSITVFNREEEGLSSNSRFLYALDSRLLLKPQPGLATLSGFQIHKDGNLTPVIDPATFALPFSAIGLAAE